MDYWWTATLLFIHVFYSNIIVTFLTNILVDHVKFSQVKIDHSVLTVSGSITDQHPKKVT